MQFNRSLHRICLGLLLIAAAGCSTIKSWFPDKERDYQFTTEIPEIVVPDDLKAGSLSTLAVSAPTEPAAIEAPVAAVAKKSTAAAEGIVAPNKTAASEAAIKQADDTQASESVASAPESSGSSLKIDQPQIQASHIVSKALSRQKLEIIERNLDKGFFVVKFDPNAVQPEDKNWLDEINFVFGDEPSHEREFRIHLRQLNPQLTEVTVQDSEGKTQSSAAANALLKLMTDAINQDISGPETPKSADANGETKPEK